MWSMCDSEQGRSTERYRRAPNPKKRTNQDLNHTRISVFHLFLIYSHLYEYWIESEMCKSFSPLSAGIPHLSPHSWACKYGLTHTHVNINNIRFRLCITSTTKKKKMRKLIFFSTLIRIISFPFIYCGQSTGFVGFFLLLLLFIIITFSTRAFKYYRTKKKWNKKRKTRTEESKS